MSPHSVGFTGTSWTDAPSQGTWLVCERIGRACISVDGDRYDCERIADENSLSQIFCDSRKDYGLFSSMSL